MDCFGRASKAGEETREKTATEKMNLKITNIQIKSYTETQTMPTLQYLADELCEDDDMEYVTLKEQEQASLEKITVGKTDSILTKLKEYPYEFEIDKDLKLAGINGVKIANDKISEGYIKPEGEKEITITANGTTTEDVSDFATAIINVNVPNDTTGLYTEEQFDQNYEDGYEAGKNEYCAYDPNFTFEYNNGDWVTVNLGFRPKLVFVMITSASKLTYGTALDGASTFNYRRVDGSESGTWGTFSAEENGFKYKWPQITDRRYRSNVGYKII